VITSNFNSIYPDRPGVIILDPGYQLHQRRLAGAILSKKSMYFSLGYFKVNATERNGASVDLAQTANLKNWTQVQFPKF
jgi:hypothetical protein